MANGDPTLTNLGIFDVSGAALKTAVDAIAQFHPLTSGARLHFVPMGFGQLQLIRVDIEGTG